MYRTPARLEHQAETDEPCMPGPELHATPQSLFQEAAKP